MPGAHNEGWGHYKETQEQLADTFDKLGIASRLTRFEKGKPLQLSW